MIPTWCSSLCLSTVCSRLVCHNFAKFFRLLLSCSFLKCRDNNTWSRIHQFTEIHCFFSTLCENEVEDNLRATGFRSFNLNVQELKNQLKLRECTFSKKVHLSIATSVVITKWQAKTKHTPLPQTEAINNGWINTSLTNHSEYKSSFFKSHAP